MRPATLLLLALAACGDDGSPAPRDIVGAYTLTQVNGAPLPFVLATGPATCASNVAGSQTTTLTAGSLAAGGGADSIRLSAQRVCTPNGGAAQAPVDVTVRGAGGAFFATGDSLCWIRCRRATATGATLVVDVDAFGQQLATRWSRQ